MGIGCKEEEKSSCSNAGMFLGGGRCSLSTFARSLPSSKIFMNGACRNKERFRYWGHGFVVTRCLQMKNWLLLHEGHEQTKFSISVMYDPICLACEAAFHNAAKCLYQEGFLDPLPEV